MMIEYVGVSGFKCFDASTIHKLPFTKETVIMGPNNSGKSALLSVVDFYRVSLWEYPSMKFQLSSGIYNWGSLEDFLHPSLLEILHSGKHPRVRFELRLTHPIDILARVDFENGWTQRIPIKTEEQRAGLINGIRGIWHFSPIRPQLPRTQRVGPAEGICQPLAFDGANVIQYLLERFTDQDPRWKDAEEWLSQIDPQMALLKTPLRQEMASIETDRRYGDDVVASVNMAYQGTGMQSVCSVVAGLVFSPPGSTIIIEEPEAFLHPKSQETVVDLMNKAVNEWDKQVIITTHSWNIILPFISDIGTGSKRGAAHDKADPEKFSLVWIDNEHKIQNYDLKDKEFDHVRADAKELWG